MSVRELALLATIGGCNVVWGLSEQDAGVTTVDVLPPDPLANECVPTFPSDNFTNEPPCTGVGVPAGTGTDTLDPDIGDLLVALPGTGKHQGGCTSELVEPFGPGGIFANVVVIADGNDYNILRIIWPDGNNSTAIVASPGGLELEHITAPATSGTSLGQTPMLATWWRIRPSQDRKAVLGEYSDDGTHWVQFGIDPMPAPDTDRLELLIGSFADEDQQMPKLARVASINVCP